MKKEILQTVSSFLHRAFTGTLVVCAFMLTSLPLAADAQTLTTYTNAPEIKYLGTVEGKLVFQIDLKSVAQGNQYVSIKDEEGNTLYSERVRDDKFSRKFAFDQEEFEGRKVSFVIQGGKERAAQTFEVARSMRLVEDLVITRL